MKPEIKIVTVDGKKALLVNGRSLLNKQQTSDQIAALDERATNKLPAAKAKLKAKDLLDKAKANIDRQIAQATEVKGELEAIVDQLD
jgi:hypothetical protein